MQKEKEYLYYKGKAAECSGRLSSLEKKSSTISLIRTVVFLVAAALIIIAIADSMLWAYILGGICFVIFFVFVNVHSMIEKNIEDNRSKEKVLIRYIERYGDGWHQFKDTGEEFLSEDDTVAADIDLLGRDSIYQMISVCHTDIGKRKLSNGMKLSDSDVIRINEKQNAVEELIAEQEFAIEFESSGIKLEKTKRKLSVDDFISFCSNEQIGVIPQWMRIMRFLLPAIELILLVLCIIGVCHYGYPLVGFLVILSISWLTKGITDSIILPFYGINYVVGDYIKLLELMSKTNFKSQLLKDLTATSKSPDGALNAFKKLGRISQAYNITFNPIVHQLLSGIILWDYQLAACTSAWKNKYGKAISNCFDEIGDMEELLSLSVLGQVRKTNFPVIETGHDCVNLEARMLYHPLINPEKVQPNGATLSNGITIITGSNMSGKTTFLRTLAINLALSYMGAPICGESLKTDYMKIFTSMRVTDDVANGISTFYAEILRIKSMADYRRNNLPMICLIDEIFKGTNSADRIVGATEAITKLAGEKCIAVVSTHDFELCSIKQSDGKEVSNYHFQEYYEDDKLMFDYKIRDGRCTTTNAMAILRMAGFCGEM